MLNSLFFEKILFSLSSLYIGDDGRDWMGVAAGLGGVVGGGLFASQSIMSSGGANRSTMLRGRKRKRKRRHVFKDEAPDVRPDEELMWDIESRPDDSRPLLIYAERLVVRGQTSRAQSYLKRALLMEEREAAASFSAVDGMQGKVLNVFLSFENLFICVTIY